MGKPLRITRYAPCLGLASGLLCLVALLAIPVAGGAQYPRGARVAYDSERDGATQIYVMDLRAGLTRQVTQGARSTSPDWSRDGRRIVHRAVPGISVTDVGRGVTEPLTDHGLDGSPVWSPDGAQVLYHSWSKDGDGMGLRVMDGDGGGNQLTIQGAAQFGHDWSPDGQKVVYTLGRDILVANADGTNRAKLTNTVASDTCPSWSPDGRSIAFISNRDGEFQLHTMDANGTDVRRLLDGPAADYDPSWLADSSGIVFSSVRDGFWEIYVVDRDGSNLRRLTQDHVKSGSPSWFDPALAVAPKGLQRLIWGRLKGPR